jgi:hypothetical protein
LTPEELKSFAHVMLNLDRDTLEQAGIMRPGQVGGGDWTRFNDEPMMFIMKLSPDNLKKLAEIVTNEMEGR